MKPETTHFKNRALTVAANIYLPVNFDSTKRYPAIVVGHPAGGVKEQTAGIYASKMAEKGFVTLAFDATYQGASEGIPRHQENPHSRVSDGSAAVDYLTMHFLNGTAISCIKTPPAKQKNFL